MSVFFVPFLCFLLGFKELARQLNCSEVYGHRRPLDGTDADLVKFYDKTGFEQSEDSDIIKYKL